MHANSVIHNHNIVKKATSSKSSLHKIAPFLGIAALLLIWQVIVWLRIYPEFIIPAPWSVVERFIDVIADGRLWLHARTTITQMLIGFFIGALSGLAVGYSIATSAILEEVLSPVLVAMQSTPIVAYAPLLVIWFGSGPTSKIISSALIVFFPLLLNTVVGVRTVPSDQRDLMRLMNASPWQTFRLLEFPASFAVMLGGLKVSATLAVIGAVVGEFVSADAGLGYLINRARYDYDTPLVVVAIVTLAFIARLMYGIISALERRALHWRGGAS